MTHPAASSEQRATSDFSRRLSHPPPAGPAASAAGPAWRASLRRAVRRAAALGLAITLLSPAGCRPAKKAAAEEKIPVRVQRVEPGTLKKSLDYAGSIRAREEAKVYPKVSGKILEKIREEGAAVAKGEVIASIDRDEVGFTFAKAPVESPLSGLVGRVYTDLGASVTPQTPIALVVDITAVELALDVPEKFIAQVGLDQAAELTLDAWPGETFTGKVTKISPVIDLDTRTAPVEITIPNPGYRLKPGMFARVQLALEERKNVPIIRKEAIQGRPPDAYVYVISNQTAQLRPVRLGLQEGSNFEVTQGVATGELVVIMGQQRLRDGATVAAEEERREQSSPHPEAKE